MLNGDVLRLPDGSMSGDDDGHSLGWRFGSEEGEPLGLVEGVPLGHVHGIVHRDWAVERKQRRCSRD
jgi:hypothetical protein